MLNFKNNVFGYGLVTKLIVGVLRLIFEDQI
jgi:hypothetical protein